MLLNIDHKQHLSIKLIYEANLFAYVKTNLHWYWCTRDKLASSSYLKRVKHFDVSLLINTIFQIEEVTHELSSPHSKFTAALSCLWVPFGLCSNSTCRHIQTTVHSHKLTQTHANSASVWTLQTTKSPLNKYLWDTHKCACTVYADTYVCEFKCVLARCHLRADVACHYGACRNVWFSAPPLTWHGSISQTNPNCQLGLHWCCEGETRHCV